MISCGQVRKQKAFLLLRPHRAANFQYMLDWLKSLLVGNPRYRFDFANAKHRCRILLIDDDPIALPIKEISNDGYNITQREAVDAELLKQCEDGVFDIIVLDYNGIAPASITPNDGFGVFERIRNSNPQQYIISVSGQTYDISKTAYFKQANDWLKKPTDLATTKDKLDTGIKFLFDRTEVIERLKRQLQMEGLQQKSIAAVINHIANRNYTDIDEIANHVKRVGKIIDISASTMGILKTIVKFGA